MYLPTLRSRLLFSKLSNLRNINFVKDEILNAAVEFQEQKRQKVLEKKLRRKANKEAAKNQSMKDFIKVTKFLTPSSIQNVQNQCLFSFQNVETAQKDFNKKQIQKEQVKQDAFKSDAKKAAWYRKELKHVVSRADVILQVQIFINL